MSVGELKRFLEENEFADDSPVGIILVGSGGPPQVRFPNRMSLATGHGIPNMLVLDLPPPPRAS